MEVDVVVVVAREVFGLLGFVGFCGDAGSSGPLLEYCNIHKTYVRIVWLISTQTTTLFLFLHILIYYFVDSIVFRYSLF